MTAEAARAKLAMPGDPDLDADVHGTTITAVVAAAETREILVRLTGGSGRWVDACSGESVDITTLTDGELSARLPTMPDDVWNRYVGQLERWRDQATPLRLTAAPGRVSLLIENRDTFIPLPRRADPLAAGFRPVAS